MKRIVVLLTLAAIIVPLTGANIFTPLETEKTPAAGPGAAVPQEIQVQTAPPIVETINLTPNMTGNKRYPGIAENYKGDRLCVLRNFDNKFWYTFYRKGGTWSTPAIIPNQPSYNIQATVLSNVDVEVDSTGRFHCVFDSPGKFAIYGSFYEGSWTTPVYLPLAVAVHDMGTALAVRSTDEVLAIDTQIGTGKDVYLTAKGKNDAQFGTPKNLTNDTASSAHPWLATDSQDNVWAVWKSDNPDNPKPLEQDWLVIYLGQWDKNNNKVGSWQMLSTPDGWSFWPQVAVNTDGKVMSEWACTTDNDHNSRLYDPATKTLGPRVKLNTGYAGKYWNRFWSRLVAHGKDFYAAVMKPSRALYLYKFDEKTSSWSQYADISKGAPVDNYDMYSGYDRLLIPWGMEDEPADVNLTMVEVEPPVKTLTIQAGTGGTTNPVPGTYSYATSSSATVTAVPNTGFAFSSWTGDVTGTTASITFTMDADKTIKANFVAQQLLTIQAGEGGTTIPAPGTYWYDRGSTVTVRAVADAAYRFNSWTGSGTGTADTIAIVMDGDKTIKANFTPQQTLTIQAGTRGTTSPVPGTYRYDRGTTASVRAVGETAYKLSSWSGDASGWTNPLSVTMDRDKTIKANFGFQVQSPGSLLAEKRMERGFLSGYYLYALAWTANPENDDWGVSVIAQRIYRKNRTDSNAQWTLLAEVAPSVRTFADRKVPKTSDYVYAVACVDSYGNQSVFY